MCMFKCVVHVFNTHIKNGVTQRIRAQYYNTNALKQDRNTRDGQRGSNISQVFKTKKILKKSIANAFQCVVFFTLNLIIEHLKVLNF